MTTVRLTNVEINRILERIRQNEEMLLTLYRQMFRQVMQQVRSRQYIIDNEFIPRANARPTY
jgi:hypothetical protein